MHHFCISRSVDKHLRSNGAQTLSRADDQGVHALALQVRGDKIGVIENLDALVPQIAVSSLLPDEIVVRDEHGAPKANGVSFTAQLRKSPQMGPLDPATVAPPQKPYFSTRRTLRPQRAAPTAAATPAAPPPITHSSGRAITGTDSAGMVKDSAGMGISRGERNCAPCQVQRPDCGLQQA